MPGIGQASAEGSRPLPTDGVHGCFVGNGLDRSLGCRKRCAHPLAPSVRGLRPQAVGERTVRLPEIFWAMARFSPSAPSGHRSPSGASATSPVSGESVSQREVFRQPGGRIYAARQCTANGRLWETRGPGMPGPYRAAAKKRTPTQPSRPSILAAGLLLTPSPQTPLLPPSRRSPPFPPYRRC